MKREHLFEVLDPPPHGLATLRSRMAERRASRWWLPLVAGGAIAATLTILTVTTSRPQPLDLITPSHSLFTEAPDGVTGLEHTAAQQLPSSTSEVVMVRVMAN